MQIAFASNRFGPSTRSSLQFQVADARSRNCNCFRTVKRNTLELVIEYPRLTAEQYGALAEKNGLRVRRIHTRAEAWDFKSRGAFFDFSLDASRFTKCVNGNPAPFRHYSVIAIRFGDFSTLETVPLSTAFKFTELYLEGFSSTRIVR